MTEYYTLKRIDNSRLVRPAAPQLWRDTSRRMGLGMLLAAAMLLYAWQHYQCLQLGYQLEDLKAGKSQAQELNQQLHLEVDSLRAPMRIDVLARNRLGLTVPVPGQVASIEPPVGPELAQARAGTAPARP